jgi:predicted Zn finger-like uncharacterized protein
MTPPPMTPATPHAFPLFKKQSPFFNSGRSLKPDQHQRNAVTRFPLPPPSSTMVRPISEIGRKASRKGSEAVAIYIFCPSCKGSYKVRDEYAGKQGVCPKCGHVIRIASSTSETQRGVPRPATRAQKEEGRRLGIEFDERITYVDLKKKIEAAQAAKPTDDAREGRD